MLYIRATKAALAQDWKNCTELTHPRIAEIVSIGNCTNTIRFKDTDRRIGKALHFDTATEQATVQQVLPTKPKPGT